MFSPPPAGENEAPPSEIMLKCRNKRTEIQQVMIVSGVKPARSCIESKTLTKTSDSVVFSLLGLYLTSLYFSCLHWETLADTSVRFQWFAVQFRLLCTITTKA